MNTTIKRKMSTLSGAVHADSGAVHADSGAVHADSGAVQRATDSRRKPANLLYAAAIGLAVFIVGALSPPMLEAAETKVRLQQLEALQPRPQSTPNNTVNVTAGILSIADNAKINFAGGNSGVFSATTIGNSRIDLLTIDSSGVLGITQGVDAPSPSAPTYPTDKLVIAEVTIDETGTVVINDADISDVRFFLNLAGNTSGK